MRSNRSIILIITALLLMAVFMPFIPVASGEPPVRAPDKYGHISSDEIWSETVTIDDIIIDEGVTVTITAGTTISPYTDAYFWVRGRLVVQGSSTNGVIIGERTGSSWMGIVVNETGSVTMSYFSMYSATSHNIYIMGDTASSISNGATYGGQSGIWMQNTKGDHTINKFSANSPSQWGIAILHNTGHITIDEVAIRIPGIGGIGLEGASNVTITNAEVSDPTGYGVWLVHTKHVTINGLTVTDNSAVNINSGITFTSLSKDNEFSDIYIEGTSYGLLFDTQTCEDTRFIDLRTDSSVTDAIKSDGLGDVVDIEMIDCRLDAAKNITNLNSNGEKVLVHFINSTWPDGSNLQISNKAKVNISWYLEGKVVNGNNELIPATVTFDEHGSSKPFVVDADTGIIDKTQLHERTIYGTGRPDVTSYNVDVQSTDHPVNTHRMNNVNIDEYTYWTLMLDLDPISTMPGTFEIMEDQWFGLDLYDHFDDPEGEDLNYTLHTSENITVEQTGGNTSGDIRIKNSEKNWFGTGWFVISAEDMAENSTVVNVTLIVLPVNDAPYFVEALPAPVIDEDTWAWLNLSRRIDDPENDTITVSFPEGPDFELVWDEMNLNLTITPIENFNGLLEIEVNLTDGMDWSVDTLYVIVRSVNDPPTFTLRYLDGSEVGMGEHPMPEGPPLSVYLFEIDEDVAVSFLVDITDVDDTNLTNIIKPEHLSHGTIGIDPLNPRNLTYTPLQNDFGGDLVKINVSDGEVTVSAWIWFKVSTVNDAPVFDAPEEWEINVDIGTQFDLDIGDLISDVDEDDLTITTDAETFITISGTVLEILITESHKGSFMEVEVTVSDGTADVERTLTIYIDNWVETFIDKWEVNPKEDKWKIEVKADEGLTLFLVVEDEEGNLTSYTMTYNNDGEYIAEIPDEIGMKGYSLWISEEEDGEPIANGYSDVLPALKEKDNAFPWWIILLIIIVIILAGAILYFVFIREGGYGGEVGDIDEE